MLVGKPERPFSNELDHPGGSLLDYFPDFEVWDPKRAKREFVDAYYELKMAA